MKIVYLLCATVGGTILLIQTVVLLLGGGGDADADVDPGDIHGADLAHGHPHEGGYHADSFLKLLSFKTLVAFVTFFGLGGLASAYSGLESLQSFGIALAGGAVALYLVAYLMESMARLQSEGNLDLQNAVGLAGKVYLRVPRGGSGHGKVTVSVQGRKLQLKAVTMGAEIPTGAEVQVVGLREPDTLEVIAAARKEV